MVIFKIHNSYTQFTTESVLEKNAITEALKYEVKNTYQLKKMLEKKYHGDNRIVYQQLNKLKYKNFIEENKFFLTGFLDRVCDNLNKYGLQYQIQDLRDQNNPTISEDLSIKGFEPYWYQKEIINKLIEKKRVIMAVGTGGGKTLSAILATKALNKKTLFITHKLDLLYQTYNQYKELTDKKVGIIGNNKFEEGDIIIGTTGTLYNIIKKDKEYALKFFSEFEFLIIDEAHRASSQSFNTIAKYCVNAKYRLGLTATPFMKTQEEDMLLEGIIGRHKLEVTPKHLIDLGILAQPYFNYKAVSGEVYKSDWHEIYTEGIVHNKERNNLIIETVLKRAIKGDKILLIVLAIEHGEILHNELKNTACKTVWVNGVDKVKVRQDVINQMQNEKIDCIIATNIFDEGIDIRAINCIVLAGGTKSAPPLFQRAGRGMRKKEKNKCLIIDFIDYQHKILLKHSLQRYKYIKEKDGYKILNSLEQYDEV